jgi:glutamate synthase (NADPH/NADH) small chain
MPKANRQEIGRQEMPTRPAEERIKCFDEVALGYTMEMAVAEASRCIQCKKPLCMSGCPVQVRIPDFILAVREGRLREAAELLKDKNSLPAICGRVCPQESQCESKCVLGRRGEPVAIGRWSALSPIGSAAKG